MCGIVGILLGMRAGDPSRLGVVHQMAETLRHRGPDGGGIWRDIAAGVAFGHRRLAIVDLSASGRQPMLTADGRFAITYNGEVYNANEIRGELEDLGYRFRGHSDTEVILAACDAFGVQQALRRFVGMFAFGLWDARDRTLYLARDRLGKKPLYFAVINNALLFASELRALRMAPGFDPQIDPAAIAAVLGQGWVPDCDCVWSGVMKLPPGTVLTVQAMDLDNCNTGDLRSRISCWWSLDEVVRDGLRNPLPDSSTDVDAELEQLLTRAVRERMVADVPLGAFLSGGLDSTTVVALMQAQASRPVRTFTIGFDDDEFDEAAAAAAVARHLGTDHTELRLSPAEAQSIIPTLANVWDEPFADESQIPTLLVSRMARRHVTVALSGDGGDEAFGGYWRHILAMRFETVFRLPGAVRSVAAGALRAMDSDRLRALVDHLPGTALPTHLKRLPKMAQVLGAPDEDTLYDRLLARGGSTSWTSNGVPPGIHLPSLADRIMLRDMRRYLPGDILVKLDRASMAVSLEARCPLLDHRLLEFAWRLPIRQKIRYGRGKWPLRRLLSRHVPDDILRRPKHGFDVPVGDWLTGPLRPWAEDLLTETRLRRYGLLDPMSVRRCLERHMRGQGDHAYQLWAMLMVQSWLDANVAEPSACGAVPPDPAQEAFAQPQLWVVQ
ncbi:asparagine synthase (glutamine-hydrolyzing) [Rhodopila globiformis]|uniref:asparagine synthase (glutamine-hydrolyzing) n=1 Tax=Rhodopila globiformis TaxID=1071 RepID=A0A2S6NC68_RHOGL|nr:asparagine synthase (glutamine-hydrolyzing) [Rhodopila globiformis]PPQ32206.1 asparagine synthase (glutamine-hydrolyzing) [Rhodopila globiformis]